MAGADQSFSFGPFVLDAGRQVLLRDGAPVSLGRRGLLLLEALLRHRGAVLGKAELMDAAWPGQAVEDSNLSVQVAQLRRVIGAGRIRTVERVGYQFLDDLRIAAEPAGAQPTISVLPFSGDRGDATGSVAEDIADALARFGSLRVLAPAGGAIAADYVVEGRLRVDGGRPELALRLIETRTGAYRWAGMLGPVTPSRQADGVTLAVRASALIEGRVEAIEVDRAAGSEASDAPAPTVAELHRRAQRHLRTSHPDGYAAAARLLDKALAVDPDNVACLAAMCEALHHRIAMGWPPIWSDDARRCRDYAIRGLAQGSVDGTAQALFGVAIYRTGDPDWGYWLMRRGAELNPASLTARVYAATASLHWGRLEDAELHYREALALDPMNPAQGYVAGGLARICMINGDFVAGLDWAHRALAANPNYGATHWTLVAANAQLGRQAEAARSLVRFRAVHRDVTIESIRRGHQTRPARLDATLEGLESAGLAMS